MSIIQEALRRKEEEEKLKDNPGETPPATNPPPPPSNRKKKGGKPWVTVLVSLVVLLFAAAGIFILMNTGLSGILGGKEDQTGDSALTTEKTPTEKAADPDPQSKLGQIVSSVGKTLEDAKNRATEQQPGADSQASAEEGANAVAASKEPLEEKVAANEKSVDQEDADIERVESEASTKPSSNIKVIAEKEKKFELPKIITGEKRVSAKERVVEWPALHIKGIMAPGRGNRGTVLIDSQLLAEGDTYKGVRVLKISQTAVLLEHEGQKRLLNTGQSVGSD